MPGAEKDFAAIRPDCSVNQAGPTRNESELEADNVQDHRADERQSLTNDVLKMLIRRFRGQSVKIIPFD